MPADLLKRAREVNREMDQVRVDLLPDPPRRQNPSGKAIHVGGVRPYKDHFCYVWTIQLVCNLIAYYTSDLKKN